MSQPPLAADELWIFGYGSLVWRPDFSFAEKWNGFIQGYERKFWQGSTDHRGVPGRPGRVATLVPQPGAVCWGTVYRVSSADEEAVLARLDDRERGGFERTTVTVHLGKEDEVSPAVSAQLYLARPENSDYLGRASVVEIADQVCSSQGPSGSNVEYVLELAQAIRAMGAQDEHLFSLESRVKARVSQIRDRPNGAGGPKVQR